MIGGFRKDRRVAEALESAVAKIRQLQADHAQHVARLIDNDNRVTAMNRRLRSATNAIDLEALIADEAHRNAWRLVTLHAAGQPTGRRGAHGLTQDQWYWAHAVLRHVGVRSAGGAWRIGDPDEAERRINQSAVACRQYGLALLRKHNPRNRYDAKKRAERGGSVCGKKPNHTTGDFRNRGGRQGSVGVGNYSTE